MSNIYTQIRAIPTVFDGVQYRSKLEAQWALFMSIIGMKYRYEPQKFDLQKYRYTPDFQIARHVYFEIKPSVIPVNTFGKVTLLATSQRVMVYLCAGDFYNDFTMLQITPTGVLTTGYDIRWCSNCKIIRIANSDMCPTCHRYLYKYEKEKLNVKRHQFNGSKDGKEKIRAKNTGKGKARSK